MGGSVADREDASQAVLQEELEGGGVHRTGQGVGRLTGGLGFSGEMPWLLCPGCGMGSHAPVTPRPNLVVLSGHLNDVLLPSIGIRDGVRCAV